MSQSFHHARTACPAARGTAILTFTLLLAGCAVQHVPPPQPVPGPAIAFPPPPEKARFYFERSLRTSADVEVESREAGFRRYVTGEQRVGEALSKPYGLAVRDSRLYVADTVRRAVFMFDLAQNRFAVIGAEDPGRVLMPLGLDVSSSGELFVVDGTRRAVLVYDASGRYLREFGGRDDLRRPSGVALGSVDGRQVAYVVDTGGIDSTTHGVVAYDAASGERLFRFGSRGSAAGEFNLPRDVAVAPNGEVFVVDGGNFRVQVFDARGRYLRGFGDVGRQGGQFSRPKELAIDAQGNVYVVDAAFGNFQIFSSAGQLLLDVGNRSARDQPAGFMLPAGIAVDWDGRVYVADQFFRRVDVFRPPSAPIQTLR